MFLYANISQPITLQDVINSRGCAPRFMHNGILFFQHEYTPYAITVDKHIISAAYSYSTTHTTVLIPRNFDTTKTLLKIDSLGEIGGINTKNMTQSAFSELVDFFLKRTPVVLMTSDYYGFVTIYLLAMHEEVQHLVCLSYEHRTIELRTYETLNTDNAYITHHMPYQNLEAICGEPIMKLRTNHAELWIYATNTLVRTDKNYKPNNYLWAFMVVDGVVVGCDKCVD